MSESNNAANFKLEELEDAKLWALVRNQSLSAFETLVRRHQAVVAAVAYNGCGDLAMSEEIAQDAFLAAWRTSSSLREPEKVRSWLCGIARNLARNASRSESHRVLPVQGLDSVAEPWQEHPTAFDEVVSREEQSLVWQSLAEIPENYREVLILFYREEQSIAGVAQALDVSEDAVKQRLSRGRQMLRRQVAMLIDGALHRTRPTAAFTLSVMAAVTVLSAGAKSMAAGSAGVAATSMTAAVAKSLTGTLATGTAAGIAGGLAGTCAGLAGGWLGAWIPAQLAPTNRERQHMQTVAWRMLIVSVVAALLLIAAIFFLTRIFATPGVYLATTLGWIVLFSVYVLGESVQQLRAVKKIRSETTPEQDPNLSPGMRQANRITSALEGRVYCSPISLLGQPLIHFNVSDPVVGATSKSEIRTARGWIAVGDRAQGILLAVGHRARGIVAIGGISAGAVSIGGISVGVVSIGGLSLGLLSIGGLGIGAIAPGGLAIGWQACGGGAIGWDFACGGGAIGLDSAYGGAAGAGNVAIGGYAIAPNANDPAILPLIEAHWMVRAMKWQIAHNSLFIVIVLCCSLLPAFLLTPIMYRRQRSKS